MAFTAWEFIRGALLTYVYFLPLTFIPFLLMFAFGFSDSLPLGKWADLEFVTGVLSMWVFMLLPSATWGLAALVPAAAGALGIGLALRRTSRLRAHWLAHGGWGFIVGIVVSGIVLGVWTFEETGGDVLSMLPTVIGFGIAVAAAAGLAWWTTAGLALRRDAQRSG